MKGNSRTLIVSALPFLGVVLLSIFAGKFALGKISEVRAKTAAEKKNQTVLSQKLNLLNQIGEDVLSSSDVSLTALPSGNPALAVISQLRKLAVENGVSLSGIKAGGEAKLSGEVKSVAISFEAEGIRPSLISFVKNIEKSAPLSLVENVKISETSGVAQANVSVKSFWADLPQKLPTLDSPASDLTSEQREILAKINSLIQPVFVEVPPSESVGREDPFIQAP